MGKGGDGGNTETKTVCIKSLENCRRSCGDKNRGGGGGGGGGGGFQPKKKENTKTIGIRFVLCSCSI